MGLPKSSSDCSDCSKCQKLNSKVIFCKNGLGEVDFCTPSKKKSNIWTLAGGLRLVNPSSPSRDFEPKNCKNRLRKSIFDCFGVRNGPAWIAWIDFPKSIVFFGSRHYPYFHFYLYYFLFIFFFHYCYHCHYHCHCSTPFNPLVPFGPPSFPLLPPCLLPSSPPFYPLFPQPNPPLISPFPAPHFSPTRIDEGGGEKGQKREN